ncbi:hypothetical protein ACIHIX_35120 [Streptomyces sp. NPDC051913]|uniref:hypothetical protein n=1 Tax=Streptomyces sp. NPDC051913 TaxID=3365676 RepID=UPI0037D25292
MKLGQSMLTAGTLASVTMLSLMGTGGLTHAADASSCTYNSYSTFGVGEIVSYKGKDTDKYNDGVTKKHSRVLKLMTGKFYDRSAGRLEKTKKGDKVWVNISHDKGKTWKSCGYATSGEDGQTITSKRYIHSSDDVKNRYMRACAKTSGYTWCADIGDKSNSSASDGQKRYWWTDS